MHKAIKIPYISNSIFYYRLLKVVSKLEVFADVKLVSQGFLIEAEGEEPILLAKRKPLMRKAGDLDWLHYSPSSLAEALSSGSFEEYYLEAEHDPRSLENKWRDKGKEQTLKQIYRERSEAIRMTPEEK